MIAQKARKRVYASDYYVIPRRTRGGSGVLRVYNAMGNLTETRYPDGTTLSYVYDKTGYLLKETASDGTEIRHTFDALGELTEIADETGTTRLRYDERGLLIGVENPLGDVVQYTYNQYGEKVGMTYPDGKQAAYTYDALSRLLSVTEPNGTTTEYTYDALGRRTSTSDGTATTAYRYDKVGNLTKQTNDAVTLTYKYDLNSRMIGETRAEGKTVTRTNYAYDKAGQLLSFRRSDGNAERYRYDPAGNMVEKTQNGTKIAMTYTAANELQSMESPHGKLTYAYDQNGNLTQKTYNNRTDTYSYDARNHLRQYRGYDNYTVKYSYNALGMLHAKEASGNNTRTTLEELIAGKEAADDPDGDGQAHLTTYTYDLTRPYYEVLTESTDGKVTSYTYGIERLAAYTEQVQTKYLYDGRGSVIQANGESKFYTPFGELLTEKVSGYGFNGEYYDAATGMLNLRARQYEPGQARFSQRDIEKGEVTNVTSLNRYAFAWNDPINLFDASGAKPEAVRNNTTVDAGDGGSYAVRIASTAQNGASANTVANTSPTKSAATGAKVANHAAVSIGYAEKGSESSVVSDAQLEYASKQGRKPTVRDNSILKEATKGACTDIPHGGHSGKFGPFGSHGGHSCEIPVLMGAYEDTTLFGSIVEGAINAMMNCQTKCNRER